MFEALDKALRQREEKVLLGSGRPAGFIAIGARGKVVDLIMRTLRKMHATADDRDNNNTDRDLFYEAVALTYDQIQRSVNTFTMTAQGRGLASMVYDLSRCCF